MLNINPESQAALQSELMSGERILWAGTPSTSVIFHRRDAFLIPFSLLWGGFTLFWEAMALGLIHSTTPKNEGPFFMTLWGIPFVVIGQYFMWGRFIQDRWMKRRTHYAVTNKRVLTVQNAVGGRRSIAASLDSVPVISFEGGSGNFGSIRFGFPDPYPNRNMASWNSMSLTGVPVFTDIEDAAEVYRLVTTLRDKPSSNAQH